MIQFRKWASFRFRPVVLLVAAGFLLTGCSGLERKDRSLKPVEERDATERHLTSDIPSVLGEAAIPALAEAEAFLPEPSEQTPLELFSVSATDVPVRDLLFLLAQDANLELDVFDDVDGNVTINAIDQTLPKILQRITAQTGLAFELQESYLVVKRDRPEWRNYQIDYLNVQRSVDSTVVLNMAVSSGPGSDDNGATSSQTEVNTTSQSDFWQSIERNVRRVVVSAKEQEQQRNAALVGITGESGESSSDSESTRLSDINEVVINREAGVISVFAGSAVHTQISEFLNTVLTRAKKEVLIEATIVEVELFDEFKSGVDWTALANNSKINFSQDLIRTNFSDTGSAVVGFSDGNVTLGLELVQRYGDTQVLSSPKIMALNNQTALLKVVDNHVYFSLDIDREEDDDGDVTVTYGSELHTVPVGLIMNVTPFISSNDEVTLSVRPTISRIIGYVEDPAVKLVAAGLNQSSDIISQVPVIREREMEAVLKVRDGQTAIIGGLMQDSGEDLREGVPGIEKVPVLGNAFAYQDKDKRKSELVIFIRPVIVTNPDVEFGDLQGFKRYMPGQQSAAQRPAGKGTL